MDRPTCGNPILLPSSSAALRFFCHFLLVFSVYDVNILQKGSGKNGRRIFKGFVGFKINYLTKDRAKQQQQIASSSSNVLS
jgi:hypothetical protein